MKRVAKLVILVLSILFITSGEKAEAARALCSSKNLRELRNYAYKVNVNYEFIENGIDSYFEIVITNLSKYLTISVDGTDLAYVEGSETYRVPKRYKDKTVINVEIRTAYGYPCVGQLLYTKKLTLPKYNIYSTMEECNEYEEFKLCRKWYDGNIENINEFHDKLEEYKKSLIKEKPELVEIEEKTFFEKVIDFYMENIIYTGTITAVLVLAVIILLIRNEIKRRRRIKIKY